MSSKDDFFQKVDENANAHKASEEALKNDMLAFQKDTGSLIQQIEGWFDNSPIRAVTSTTQLVDNGSRVEVPTLMLHNRDKTLTITPEGLYYFGVTGSLQVTIDNPGSAPRTSNFSLHWKDAISKLDGWVIVYGGAGNTAPKRIEFNQDNFFNMISSFA